jgi:hypothetical protein
MSIDRYALMLTYEELNYEDRWASRGVHDRPTELVPTSVFSRTSNAAKR